MSRPTRATVAGRAFLDVQNLARRRGRATGELLTIYALEGFLARLAASPHAESFVLKGGVLLAAFDVRRPTRDIDLLASNFANDANTMLALVREIAQAQIDDGLLFDSTTSAAEVIRDDDVYSGVPVSLFAHLASAKLPIHVDINVGDPVVPAPQRLAVPRLLGGTVELNGYPLTMVLAEKIITAVQRGPANTRWRDFADIHLLTGRHVVRGEELQQSLTMVAAARDVTVIPLEDLIGEYAKIAQGRWVGWLRKQKLDQTVPQQFALVLNAFADFAGPGLRGTVATRRWDPDVRNWVAI